MKKYFLIVLASLAFGACETQFDRDSEAREKKRAEARLEEEIQSGKNCLARGKIVVRSSWDGRIIDCK